MFLSYSIWLFLSICMKGNTKYDMVLFYIEKCTIEVPNKFRLTGVNMFRYPRNILNILANIVSLKEYQIIYY